MIIGNFKNKKVVDYLNKFKNNSACFIFHHGLGDFINFLPLYEYLKSNFTNWKLDLYSWNHYKKIYPKCLEVPKDIRILYRKYQYIFSLSYPELRIEENFKTCKVYNCNEKEIGLKNFVWKPYNIDNIYNKDSKIIGFHGFGNTNVKNKNVDNLIMKQIWDEIKSLNYEPFEIHFNNVSSNGFECPKFINKNNSLRFENPDMDLFLDKIKQCKYFIGIESGPYYLAGSILGFDKCIALEKYLKFNHIPIDYNLVDIIFYEKNSVKNKILELDKLTKSVEIVINN